MAIVSVFMYYGIIEFLEKWGGLIYYCLDNVFAKKYYPLFMFMKRNKLYFYKFVKFLIIKLAILFCIIYN